MSLHNLGCVRVINDRDVCKLPERLYGVIIFFVSVHIAGKKHLKSLSTCDAVNCL